jgi:hypothetical protein
MGSMSSMSNDKVDQMLSLEVVAGSHSAVRSRLVKLVAVLMLQILNESLRGGLLYILLGVGVSRQNRGFQNCQTSIGVVRTLLNPYMLSCRTNDEKRACRKYLGRMEFSKALTLWTVNAVPFFSQEMYSFRLSSARMLSSLPMKLEVRLVFYCCMI